MSTRNKKERRISNTETQEFGMVAFRQGPLPPPAELEKYENMFPGATKLLFDNFIRQSDHRMELEKAVIKNDAKRAGRGQIISAVLAFLCIVSGSILTYFGKDTVGLSLIFGSIGTLLTAFYGGAILRKIERVQKAQK
jgi:uncharacterized membrane protein